MSIHREGTSILFSMLVVLVLLNLVFIKALRISRWRYTLLTMASVLLYLWMLYFFRNPSRDIMIQEGVILSPADGKIVAIQPVYEDEYFQEDCIQVSIFMSPFNVHVNRSPISGTIQYFKYHPGQYLVAFHPKSSTKNERTTVAVKRQDGMELLFRQIAGFMARRIKFYPQQDDFIKQGDEVGFIKFGSRLDVFLPLGAQVKVKLGERVRGGISVLAEL
ncbi:MAG: phosphatidylserine decarboxylase family protein [Bacteroidota bacterium]